VGKYNFENDNHDMDETRMVGEIQEKIKKMEKANDLGDKDAFLDTFSSVDMAKKEKEQDPLEEEETRGNRQGVKRTDVEPPIEKTEFDGEQEGVKIKRILSYSALLGGAMFILVFGLIRCFSGGGSTGAVVEKEGEILGVIQEVTEDGNLSIYDIDEEKIYQVKTNKSTVFLDKEEQPWDLKVIEPGWILSVLCDAKTGIAEKIRYADKVWEKEEVTPDVFDKEQKKITLDEETLSYGAKTLFLSQEEKISDKDLESCDVMTLRGVGDEVYAVDIIRSHGYVLIKNKEKIKDGVLTIDGKREILLSGEQSIPVVEGGHSLLVTGSNIEERQITVALQAGEEYIFDLSLTQEKTGVLIIKTNIPTFQLTVNGTTVDGSKPVVLTLGEYDIVVSQAGYQSVSKHISIQQPSLALEVKLEEDAKYGQVQILADQVGATVYIDQVEIGVAPIQKKLKYGDYEIMVKKEGCEIFMKTITVGSPNQDVGVKLVEVQ